MADITILEWCIIGAFGLCGLVWLVLPFIVLRNFSPFQAPPQPFVLKNMDKKEHC